MNIQSLLKNIKELPSYLSFTPVFHKKPYRLGWNSEPPLPLDAIAPELIGGTATGIGLRAGTISNGTLIVDFDGYSALDKFKELFGIEPPQSLSWSSGKEGRFSAAFKVASDYWDKIFNKTISTGNKEQLEFFWDGKQSVLPGSLHPEGRVYQYVNKTEIADCPQEIIDYFSSLAQPKEEKQSEQNNTISGVGFDNPYDIRNFAHHLEGYQELGRKTKGWHTAKCPCHNGRSNDSLHINVVTGQFKCQSGCDGKNVYEAALDLAISKGYANPRDSKKKKVVNKKSLIEILQEIGKPSEVRNQLYDLGYTPDITFNESKLPNSTRDFIKQGNLVAIRSPKGTGKSHQLKEAVKHFKNQGIKILAITRLNNLGEVQANNYGLVHHHQTENPNNETGLVITPESLYKLNPEKWRGCFVISDETEQTVRTFGKGKTLGRIRGIIIDVFNRITRNASAMAILDADLEKRAINYISGCAPNLSLKIIENTGSSLKWDVNVIESTKETTITDKILSLLKKGKKLAIANGSIRNSKLLKKIIEETFPKTRVMSIHSENSKEPEIKDFITNINERATDYDVLIYTSSLGTGVSIDIEGYFDYVIGMFWSRPLTAAEIAQMLGRVRDNVPRYLWVTPHYYPYLVTTKAEIRFERELKLKANQKITNIDYQKCDSHFYDMQLGVQSEINKSFKDTRTMVYKHLYSEGHNLTPVDAEENKALAEELKRIKEEIKQEYASAVIHTPLIGLAKYEELDWKPCLTYEERLAKYKFELVSFYGVEPKDLTVDLILKDNEGKLQIKIRDYINLLKKMEDVISLDARDFTLKTKPINGRQSTIDSDLKYHALKRQCRDRLGVNLLLKPGLTWEENSVITDLIKNKIKQYPYESEVLGIKQSNRWTICQIINKLLSDIGLEVKSKRSRLSGSPKRVYCITQESLDRANKCYQVVTDRENKEEEKEILKQLKSNNQIRIINYSKYRDKVDDPPSIHKEVSSYAEGGSPSDQGINYLLGKAVSYVGTRFKAQYGTLKLVVKEIVREVNDVARCACQMPDGELTTWLLLSDIRLIE